MGVIRCDMLVVGAFRHVVGTGKRGTMTTKRTPGARRPDAAASARPKQGRLARTHGVPVNPRGEKTRQRITETIVELFGELQRPPTAQEVATRAGVSVRLVFHHFADMPTLYRSAGAFMFNRYWLPMGGISGTLTLDQRIRRTVQARGKLFEQITFMRHAATAMAPLHSDVGRVLDVTNAMLRTWLEETFERELTAAGAGRLDLLQALEVSASWETWDRLARIQKLSPTATRRIMAHLLHALLDSATSRP